jgi:hypothetical protein
MAEVIGSKRLANLSVRDSSFIEMFLSIRNLGVFYGASQESEYGPVKQLGFYEALDEAFNQRIKKPIERWTIFAPPETCFFQPYTRPEAAKSILFGLILPAAAIISGLGLIALHTVNPIGILVYFCLPAVVELISGLVGLGQALWHQLKVYMASNDEDSLAAQALAERYFIDALVRFALVIPLAAVSLIATPLDLIRFFTRGISTLIHGLLPTEPSQQEMDQIGMGHQLGNEFDSTPSPI